MLALGRAFGATGMAGWGGFPRLGGSEASLPAYGDAPRYDSELGTHRAGVRSTLPLLTTLWRQTHQLVYSNHADDDRVPVLVRSFAPAPHFAAGTARVPVEFVRYSERMRRQPCANFTGHLMACGIEWDEWVMSTALIRPTHVIIEFGARYGTTSCVLANATGNSGNVVSVEPDNSAWEDLLFNRDRNRCNFHVVRGLVGQPGERKKPDGFYNSGYGRKTSSASAFELASDTLSFTEIEERIGARVNAALVDCEGCIEEAVFKTGLIDQLSLLLLEEDGNIDYRPVYRKLAQHGLQRIWRSHDTAMPGASWSAKIEHSAWQRPDAAGSELPRDNEICWSTKERHGYSDRQLNCSRSVEYRAASNVNVSPVETAPPRYRKGTRPG